MNKIYLSAAILLILPLLLFGYLAYTDAKCNELAEIITLADNLDAQKSGELLETAREKWGSFEKILGISANHSVIDSINEGFTKAAAWQILGEEKLFSAELKNLNRLIQHLSETEKPTLFNIF